MGEDEEEFWDSLGSENADKALLVNSLTKCPKNKVTIVGGDPRELMIEKVCPNLTIDQDKSSAEFNPSSARIYCEKCGFICMIRVEDPERVFGSRWSDESEPNEPKIGELDEFLGIAGTQSISDDEDLSWSDDEDDDYDEDSIS
jgi:hypothetical protein